MSQENRIYVWLIVVIVLAAGYRYYRYTEIKNESEAFLQKKDSLFYVLKKKSDSIFVTLDSLEYAQRKMSLVPVQKVDINRSSEEELTVIPGIGSKMARRIIDYRHANGPFQSTEDLIRVKGIGEKTLGKMKEWVVTGNKK